MNSSQLEAETLLEELESIYKTDGWRQNELSNNRVNEIKKRLSSIFSTIKPL